jgi:hypothetical protein
VSSSIAGSGFDVSSALDHPFRSRGQIPIDAPTRTRTRDSSLGPRCDFPLHHRGDGIERKARDSNPHSPWGNRISNAAQPTVSGYLPNPSLRTRERPSGPPGSRTPISWLQARCRPVGPAALFDQTKVRPRIELGPPPYHGGMPPTHPRTRFLFTDPKSVVPEGVEPPFPLCKRGVVAIGPRDDRLKPLPNGTSGIRTHKHQALDLIAMPVRVPCRC